MCEQLILHGCLNVLDPVAQLQRQMQYPDLNFADVPTLTNTCLCRLKSIKDKFDDEVFSTAMDNFINAAKTKTYAPLFVDPPTPEQRQEACGVLSRYAAALERNIGECMGETNLISWLGQVFDTRNWPQDFESDAFKTWGDESLNHLLSRYGRQNTILHRKDPQSSEMVTEIVPALLDLQKAKDEWPTFKVYLVMSVIDTFMCLCLPCCLVLWYVYQYQICCVVYI